MTDVSGSKSAISYQAGGTSTSRSKTTFASYRLYSKSRTVSVSVCNTSQNPKLGFIHDGTENGRPDYD